MQARWLLAQLRPRVEELVLEYEGSDAVASRMAEYDKYVSHWHWNASIVEYIRQAGAEFYDCTISVDQVGSKIMRRIDYGNRSATSTPMSVKLSRTGAHCDAK